MALGMRVVRCVLILACGGLFLMGTLEMVVWLQSSTEPEPVTIDQWGASDGTRNRYIKLTGFTFDEEFIEYRSANGKWHYVPLKLSNGDWPERPLVVVHEVTPAAPNQWEEVYDLSEITGLITVIGHDDPRNKIEGQMYAISRQDFKFPVSIISPGSKPPAPGVFGPIMVISALVGLVCVIIEIPIFWKDWTKMVEKQNTDYLRRKQAEEKAKETFEI